MGRLSDTLREMGFTPTGEDSPVDDEGELWSKSIELVCDETGIVIDGNHHSPEEDDDRETHNGRVIHRYPNSERVRMVGGYFGSYDWGHDGDEFRY